MNWKINYWTLLFVLAAAGFCYQMFGTSSVVPHVNHPNPDPDPDPCATVPDVVLVNVDTALGWIQKHVEVMTEIDAELDEADYDKPVGNIVLDYVHLQRCELNEMLDSIPDSDVFIFPTVETIKVDGKDSTVFSLVLGDQPYRHKPGERDTFNVETANFFDFARPCPPTCPF